MRIAHLGTFDVANYGDLLFPLLLERRIRAFQSETEGATDEIEFVHFSPRGGAPVWSDARATLPVRELFDHGPFDVVVLGGGHLVHALPTKLADYQSSNLLTHTAYVELWLGAARLAARDGARLIWNAPGVPRPLEGRAAELLHWATAQVDYLAVRDEVSAEHLHRSGVTTAIRFVPDTALGVRCFWSEVELEVTYRQVFDARHRERPARTIAVQVNDRYLRESPATLAERLDGLCESQHATAILLALGPCHGDDDLARRVGKAMQTSPVVIDSPTSLLQLTACLAKSQMYLGSSLHGAIVATAYGRTAWCVAREQPGGPHKFTGFLEQVSGSARLAASWEVACRFAADTSERDVASLDLHPAHTKLDVHWQTIGRLISDHHYARSQKVAIGHEQLAELDRLLPKTEHATRTQLAILTAQAETSAQALGRSDRSEAALEAARQREASFSAGLARQKKRLLSAQTKARQAENHLRESQRRLKRSARDLEALNGWLNYLRHGVDALLSTRRWRLGNWLGNGLNRALLRAPAPLATELLQDVFRRHARWLGARDSESRRNDGRIGAVIRQSQAIASIVVTVHNATASVRNCLESLTACTDARHELVLVDDASADDCRGLLADFAAQRAKTTLLRHDERQGYTRAANSGWRIARGDFVVLLNSDTILTPDWLERLIACFEGNTSLGLVGPLSNAASWQSVPERFDPQGDWAVNALPKGWSASDMATLLARATERRHPRVPLLNGFCLAIQRAVWDQIGYFDESAFPDGYGEETDYCLRAAAAGFQIAVADDAYVYHAKSQSYGHQRRAELTERGQRALRAKHGDATLQRAVDQLRNEPTLATIRERVSTAIASRADALPLSGGDFPGESVIQRRQADGLWEASPTPMEQAWLLEKINLDANVRSIGVGDASHSPSACRR